MCLCNYVVVDLTWEMNGEAGIFSPSKTASSNGVRKLPEDEMIAPQRDSGRLHGKSTEHVERI